MWHCCSSGEAAKHGDRVGKISEGLSEEVRKSHVCMGEGRGNRWCKGPEAGISLAYLRISREAPVAAAG